jgi:hypothetical protein
MTVPFRKDEADDRELTTADLAGAKNTVDVSRNEVEAGRLKPVRSERSAGDFPANQQSGIPAPPGPTPLFPDDQLCRPVGAISKPASSTSHAMQ